jgi:hypothetical protein
MIKKLVDKVGSLSLEKIKNDRRIFVFAVCLFIATALWFLNALSKDYSTKISLPVKFVNPPDNMFLTSDPPAKFQLNIDAHGFSLLRHKLSLATSPIILDLNTLYQQNDRTQNIITLQTQSLIARISEQVSSEITITAITPQVLTLIFDSLETRTLPVKPNIQTQFKSQFYQKGEIIFTPESIRVSGPASVLDTLRNLTTEFTEIKGIDSDVEKTLRILPPENTDIGKEKVTVKIPVERFTEKEITVPIQVKNKPEDISVKLFPSEVKISFLVGMSEYENITAADFRAFVDYNQANYDTETLELNIGMQPPFLQMLRLSPQEVEFLIETD